MIKGRTYICEHGKRKDRCRECGGSGLCEHGKRKERCRECGGSGLCEHGKQKAFCRECSGSALCEHGKQKAFCRECGGSSLCQHGNKKSRCIDCGGSEICKTVMCPTRGSTKYEGYCMPCFVNNPENQDKPAMRNYKTKEKYVVDRITKTYTNFTWVADRKVQDGCSLRRPDLLLDMGSHIIILEVDENKHSNYDCICENKRLMILSQDLQHRPIVFIRFNPDSYINQDGVFVRSCWELNKKGIMSIRKEKKKNGKKE